MSSSSRSTPDSVSSHEARPTGVMTPPSPPPTAGDEAIQPSEPTMDESTAEAKRDESPLDGSPWESLGSDPKSDEEEDDTSSHVSDPEIINLDLTPIENNMPRDYIDIAVTFPCPRVPYIETQMVETERETLRAYYQTLERWPFLTGSLKTVKKGDEEKLTLVHEKDLTRAIVSRILQVQQPRGGHCEPISPHDAPLSTFGRDCFFEHDPDVDNAEDFPPVTLQINFKDGVLVLGFSFSRVMFDGLAIHNFLRQYLRNTSRYRTTYSVTTRDMPVPIGPGPDDKQEPLFWEWDKELDPEEPTPGEELVVRNFKFGAGVVEFLRQSVRAYDSYAQSGRVPNAQDCVFALFWSAIVRARCENCTIVRGSSAMAHVMMPGYFKKPHPWEYIGNSTVDAVARGWVSDLAGPYLRWNNQRAKVTENRRLAHAADLLSQAQCEINTVYMRKLHGLKQVISPAEDRLASARALDRHTHSVCFEDWTGYASYCEAEIPYITNAQPSIFPCPEQLKEGTVIILPREDKTSGPEDWYVCVCLQENDMYEVEDILDGEGWWAAPEEMSSEEPEPRAQRELRPKGQNGTEGRVKTEN